MSLLDSFKNAINTGTGPKCGSCGKKLEERQSGLQVRRSAGDFFLNRSYFCNSCGARLCLDCAHKSGSASCPKCGGRVS